MISHSSDRVSAYRLLEILSVKNNPQPPTNVEAIAKSIGIEITYENMLCDGSLEEIGQNRYLIKVNNKSNKLRQRFTIAHEIAHLIVKTANRSEITCLLEKNFQRKKGFTFDWSNDEKLCDFISASILVPPTIAKKFSDWKTFSIQKSLKASRKWQVSLSTFLWSVFAVAQYEGGFIWYKMSTAPNDLTNIQMNYSWSKFPKSRKIDIPKTVFLRLVSNSGDLNYSIIDFTRNEERFHPRVKFEFNGLSEYRAMRIKAFGKGREKKILVVVYPKEIKPEVVLPGNWQRTII